MKKRVLCFLTAVLVMFLPVLGFACVHYNDTVEPKDLITKGFIEPQVGVPGYSGDLCCPICGEVIVPGKSLPAKTSPSGSSGNTEKPEETGTQTKPEEAVQPEKPVQPAPQAKPEEPAQPQKPAQPAPGEKQQETAKPKTTAQPKKTARPEKTVKPAGEPAGGNTKESGAEKPERERFSKQYPYRRVKMNPEAGIRAEAAGTLLWPAAISPFQSLFN